MAFLDQVDNFTPPAENSLGDILVGAGVNVNIYTGQSDTSSYEVIFRRDSVNDIGIATDPSYDQNDIGSISW